MKIIIAGVVLAVVMGLAVTYRDAILGSNEGLTYVKEKTMEVVKEEPKEAWMTDEEAIQAAKDVIRKKELQAELEQLDIEIKEKQEKRKQVATELNAF
jgi:putative SOS response-associated peptidase YedK